MNTSFGDGLNTIEHNNNVLNQFTFIDYSFFVIMLLIYIGIGVYFGYFDAATKTVEGYLYGSGKLKVVPIAVSLMSSSLSAFSIVAIPAEIYAYGSQYMTGIAIHILCALTANYILLPIFFKNGLTNSYLYLDRRFSKSLQTTFIVMVFLFSIPSLPFVSYIPSLAFAQVSGLNVHLINTFVLCVCMFYTMMGGIKAVVWTDVVQAAIMFGGLIIIIVSAITKIGGFEIIWTTTVNGNRLQLPDMTLDLTTRSTFWNIFLGQYIHYATLISVNPINLQRILAFSSISKARRSVLLYGIGLTIFMIMNCSIGLIIYTHYVNCDPIKNGVVKKIDQILPYFVQEIVGYIPGMSGIFISCIFSASLSTISPAFNSIAGIIYNDYIRQIKNYKHTNKKADRIMKLIVIITAVFCMVMGMAYDNLKSMLQIFISIVGLTNGPILAIFLFGIFYPHGNSKGAYAGLFSSIITVTWILIGSLWHTYKGKLSYPTLPTSIEGCEQIYNYDNLTTITMNLTQTISEKTNAMTSEEGFSIYNIAFTWYSLIGFLVFFIVAIPISHLTGNFNDIKKLNPNLIHPMAHFLLPKNTIVPTEFVNTDKASNVYEPSTKLYE